MTNFGDWTSREVPYDAAAAAPTNQLTDADLAASNAGAHIPFDAAIEAATVDGIVDSQSPELTVTVGASTIIGTAEDNYAILGIKWRDSTGRQGMAEHDFVIDTTTDEDWPHNYVQTWHVNWTIPLSDLAPAATSVTITAIDTHRNQTQTTVSV